MGAHIIAGPDGTAEVQCAQCGRVQAVRLPAGTRSSTPVRIRVRCDCGQRLVVYLERRAAGRKTVDLEGVFRVGPDELARPIRVCNLSRSGLLFAVEDGEAVPAEGDLLVVEFTLTHAESRHFVKEVVVRRVNGNEVGAEFAPGPDGQSYDRVYDLALALYQPAPHE